jgi:hypothetical protein
MARAALMPAATLLAVALSVTAAMAGTTGFDQDRTGLAPEGWRCGVTGRGEPHWSVEAATAAPTAPNVLRQSGYATFAWCARRDSELADGFVEVKFKPMQGREDRAGGLVWRFKDGDNYYVARANALENNLSLYYTVRGRRNTIKYVDAPVRANEWHALRVQFTARRIQVSLDGTQRIDVEDDHIGGAGAVGVWTKADSVTEFDDFSWGER